MSKHHPNLCRSCARLNEDEATCAAYPDGIPDEIRVFGADHRGRLPGDHDIQYLFDGRHEEDRAEWMRIRGQELGDTLLS